MGACGKHQQGKFVVVLLPYQQPVRLNMSLPLSMVISMKDVWPTAGTAYLYGTLRDSLQI